MAASHWCRSRRAEVEDALLQWGAHESDREIARRLGLAERSVENWRWRLGIYHTRQSGWYTTGEAARVTGLSQQRLSHLARTSRIRARQRGGRRHWWVIAPEDVERLVREHNPALWRRWEEHIRSWSR